jgi:hypothetical protein
MHVPTLPSLPTWETPIAASREIVEAISDAADSAVDAATSAVRSARRRRSGRRAMRQSWRWAVAAALVVVAVVAVRRRRATGGSSSAGPTQSVDHDGVGRSDSARTDGLVQEYGDVLADSGARRAGSSVAD